MPLQANQQRGFTIVELMVVVVIAAILATLAGPSFTAFVNETRQNSTLSQLQADLNRARSEAIKRNARMLVCNPNSSGKDCSTATTWNSGWIVCYDVDGNDHCDVTAASNPNPVVWRGALHANLTLTVSVTPLRFNPVGTAGGAAVLTLAGNWDGAQNKVLTVSATGNITR